MRFGPVALSAAKGALLAHSRKAPGWTLAKGTRLGDEDLALLAGLGVEEVVVARLDPGDVHEDEAAARVAAALLGPGLTLGDAFTGRANLFAGGDGLLRLDTTRFDRLNALCEGLTVATLPPFAKVAPRQMVATVKIIPFALPETVIAQAEALLAGAPALEVALFRPMRLALIQTHLPETAGKMLDKTASVTAGRMAALGARMTVDRRCPHDTQALAACLSAVSAEKDVDLIAVAGASAIVDRGDVIPAALARVGGRVDHLGMPVDPGNLILLGELAGRVVLGLPGCARSPAINGFDWVLDRLCAGLAVGGADLMAMGVGGLLKDTTARTQPRMAAATVPSPAAPPRIGALVLAAGLSRRMGGVNKLLLDWRGKPLVAHAVDTVLAAGPAAVAVVIGHQGKAVRAALEGRAVALVENPDPGRGLGSSLKRGLAALPADLDGVIVCLGDMPGLTPRLLSRLIAAFAPVEGRAICLPTFGGRRGNPVLFAARFLPEMMEITGDIGARPVIAAHPDQTCEVAMDALAEGASVLMDVDTPEAAKALLSAGG
ncbi:4-diphosphocytidyl-2C-methyl-D-erythritol kinase [Rhodospirillum rubrum]|uniref:NTP transferase domain-containing protein n=1 Tax=Rhodospirillum rubrum TaxID=1085 RepID=UPI0019060AEB|nr:molybdopterin-binding/glycosyltransferase family 2 protein [Rhodospirillum rubrum]MBK1663954.1 4-diphosphocytidyl-2C-methyl-D-erythritol kinase [Rhodospirillum rubrum]MBK1676596.1 4-diphosphocytidyl-2C-methyl-D-erythritol kinase [Rhodospirillum rubrum]